MMISRYAVLLVALLGAACSGPHKSPQAGSPAPAAARAAATDALAGKYRVEHLLANGSYTYAGEAFVVPRAGAAYDLYWYRYRADGRMGLGLSVDGVLGAAYLHNTSEFTGLGVAIYRIDGGMLDGIRLLDSSLDGATGTERLEGPADLQGRFAIARSVNAYGASNYAGYVEISRRDGRYLLEWRTPDRAYVGLGVRVGDKLVVAFSAEPVPPGVLGYCVTHGGMAGAGAEAFSGALERQHLQRRTGTAGTDVLPDCAAGH